MQWFLDPPRTRNVPFVRKVPRHGPILMEDAVFILIAQIVKELIVFVPHKYDGNKSIQKGLEI